PRDNEQLLEALEKLKKRGNSVVVVEHDEETMRRADHIIDLGPGAGLHGGQLVAAGTLGELARHPESITGQCLRAHKSYPARGQRRHVRPVDSGPRRPFLRRSKAAPPGTGQLSTAPDVEWLTLEHADKNNLKNLTVKFPLGRLVLVTGVSGS